MKIPEAFDWKNYGDVNFMEHGGELVKSNGKGDFEIVSVVGDCDTKTARMCQYLWLTWDRIFDKDGKLTDKARSCASCCDALDEDGNVIEDRLMWVVTNWVHSVGSDESRHIHGMTAVRKWMKEHEGITDDFIKSIT